MSTAKPLPARTPPAAYDRDAYAWAFEQAAFLRQGRFDRLDIENIAEELETLGRTEFAKLRSSYRIIILHLLRWDHQPERRSRSWVTSILTQRVNAAETLEENPSLKGRVPEALERAYALARIEAAGETGLPQRTFPEACPYDLDAVMNREVPWVE